MKTYDEIAESIIKKYNLKLERKKRRALFINRVAVSVSGIFAAVIVCAFAFKSNYFLRIPQNKNIDKDEFRMITQTEVNTTAPQTSVPVISSCSSVCQETQTAQTVTASTSNIVLSSDNEAESMVQTHISAETVTTAVPLLESVQPPEYEENPEDTAQNEDVPPAVTEITAALEKVRLENPCKDEISALFPLINLDIDKTYEFLDSEVSADKLDSLIKTFDIEVYDDKSTTVYLVTANIYSISDKENDIIAVRFGESDKIYAYGESSTAGLYSNRIFADISLLCGLYESQISNISPEYVAHQLLETSISGTNDLTNEKYESDCTVFAIKGISEDYAVAVRLADSDRYMLYRNPSAMPKTLDDMAESLSLSENLHLGTVYRYDENNNLIPCGNIESKDFSDWLLSLPTSECLPFGAFTSVDFIIEVSLPVLNMTERVVEVSENGYIRTNIIDSGAVFFVGEDNIQKLKDIFL